MSEASYLVRFHRAAERELDGLEAPGAEDLHDRIYQASKCREPTSHRKVKHLEGGHGLVAVRAEGCRAICELVSPEFRVLLVDKRRTVYDRIDVAIQRGENVD